MPLDCNLQSSARGLSPLLPIPLPCPRSPAAYHGVVPITDTYMSSYQTRMGTRQNIQSAKCRLSEIDIGEPAAATLHVSLSPFLSLALVENFLSFSLALLHWSKTFSLASSILFFVVFLSHLFIRRILSLSVSPSDPFSRKISQRAQSSSRITAKFFPIPALPLLPYPPFILRYQLARFKSILATIISIGPSITMNVIWG